MSARDSASTFAKGLAVLRCFERGQSDLTMADVARLTGFDRATARRLCLTLESSGYLRREGKALRLTPRILAIGGGYLAAEGIGKSVQPVLNQYAETLQGEIALAVRDGTRAVYVARSAVPAARLSMGLSVGSTLPLLPTAVGRMLLGCCPEDVRANLIDRCEIAKFTETTDVDRASIRTKIADAARTGYAHVVGEFERGAAGLAVPAPPISGAEAVLATTASANRLSEKDALDYALDVLFSAALSLRG